MAVTLWVVSHQAVAYFINTSTSPSRIIPRVWAVWLFHLTRRFETTLMFIAQYLPRQDLLCCTR